MAVKSIHSMRWVAVLSVLVAASSLYAQSSVIVTVANSATPIITPTVSSAIDAATLGRPRGLVMSGRNLLILASESIYSLSPDGTLSYFFKQQVAPDVRTVLSRSEAILPYLDGSVLLADAMGHSVWKITATGQLTKFAGTGIAGSSGDGGQAIASLLQQPRALASDLLGNVFIADFAAGTVRMVLPNGKIDTLISKLQKPIGIALQQASSLQIIQSETKQIWTINIATRVGTARVLSFQPCSIVSDPEGNTVMGDCTQNRVFGFGNGVGIGAVLAGTGDRGYSPDGTVGQQANLSGPTSIAAVSGGSWYFIDNSALIRLFKPVRNACSYFLGPAPVLTVPFNGLKQVVGVSTQPDCPWTAIISSELSLGDFRNLVGLGLNVESLTGKLNNGDATFILSVLENQSEYPRSGTLTVAGQAFKINQASADNPCRYVSSPSSISFPAPGGTSTIAFTANRSNCPSPQIWIKDGSTPVLLPEGASRTLGWLSATRKGLQVILVASPNAALQPRQSVVNADGTSYFARYYRVLAAGTDVTITQNPNVRQCTYTLSQSQISLPNTAGTGVVTYSVNDAMCPAPSIASDSPWLTSTLNGKVLTYVVQSSPGAARAGTIFAGNAQLKITQAGGGPLVSISSTWIPVRQGQALPVSALEASSVNGIKSYICRSTHLSKAVPGILTVGLCEVALNGTIRAFTEFDVLIGSSSSELWQAGTTNAFQAGEDESGLLFACRGPLIKSGLYFGIAVGFVRGGQCKVADLGVESMIQPFWVLKNSFSGIVQGPSITSVLNSASFRPTIAPGSIFTVFGKAISTREISADTAAFSNWPAALNDVSIRMNGQVCPIYYSSQGQLNGFVPFGILPGTAVVIVYNLSGPSIPFEVEVVLTDPGIFEIGEGRAAALNQDFSLNSVSRPAMSGSVISVFMTGQGMLDRRLGDGLAAPTAPLFNSAAPVTATIGGFNSRVDFAGLAVGFVGLLQVNLIVPELNSGTFDLLISINGRSSNRTVISIEGGNK